jgi:hypothetical protein
LDLLEVQAKRKKIDETKLQNWTGLDSGQLSDTTIRHIHHGRRGPRNNGPGSNGGAKRIGESKRVWPPNF